MNWALPLLFILLSPGFLLSLGSKCKISIMTILIHALIFTIIINVYGKELEGFQASGSSPSGASPSGASPSGEMVIVGSPSGSELSNENNNLKNPFVLAMLIPSFANAFYTENVDRDPSIASNVKLLPNVPSQPSPSGSEPTQYQKNTLALQFILSTFYQNNLKDICNMKDPTGSPAPWVPVTSLPPNSPNCPKCPSVEDSKSSFFCTIM
jgi:hypothetical protein